MNSSPKPSTASDDLAKAETLMPALSSKKLPPEIEAQLRPFETEINQLASRYQTLENQTTPQAEAERQQIKPRLKYLYYYYEMQCAALRTEALNTLNQTLDKGFQSLWKLNQDAQNHTALEDLLKALGPIQAGFRQAESDFKAHYLKLVPPQDTEVSQIMRDFLVEQLKKLEALSISNESAFQLARQAETPNLKRLQAAPKALLFPEKLSLLKLRQALNQIEPCYFGLRKYLLQKQMQPAHPLTDLKKALRSLTPPSQPTPYAGWPLQPQAETLWRPREKPYRYYLKAGYHWLQTARQDAFQTPHYLRRSLTAFHRALALNPTRSEAFFGLAYLHALLGDKAQAQAFLSFAHTPEYPEYHQLKALL